MPDPPTTVAPLARRILPQRAATVIAALLFASVACWSMIAVRGYVGDQGSVAFMSWNLLLAWIPLLLAFVTYAAQTTRFRWRGLLFAGCAVTWFFFFPNAPYIITDFIHLDVGIPPAMLWLDLFIIASSAWTGLCLGYVSLCLMQEIVAARSGRMVGWVFVLGMLILGSLGVYMGRFLRWNSWDVLRHPFGLFEYSRYDHERFVHPAMKVFLPFMFLFLVLSYGTLYTLAQLHERDSR